MLIIHQIHVTNTETWNEHDSQKNESKFDEKNAHEVISISALNCLCSLWHYNKHMESNIKRAMLGKMGFGIRVK